MSQYSVKHLHSGETFTRRDIFLNEKQQDREWHQNDNQEIEKFHEQLPHYGETKLYELPDVASKFGIGHVFIKDESTRLGLPSFKILGASWAMHRAVCKRLGLPSSTLLADLREKISGSNDLRLVTCSEGNWGRACARMAQYIGIPISIFVPGFMNEYTRSLIRGEGADVGVLEDGSYDDTIAAVKHDANNTGSLMVMDTSWDGYEEVPGWVSEGYSTMLRETDRQVAELTNGNKANIAFVSVGVGSWAHSVVAHYKSVSKNNRIITVEPDTAASFKESLHCNAITPIETGDTIMNGMNCGTTSTIAWPVLRGGTFAAMAVNDTESNASVQYLQARDINSGPCGAANLAALRKACKDGLLREDERKDAVVVLFSTEGNREYAIPS